MQGAIVANYPWDGNAGMATQYEASPDDTAFRHLASVYARAHKNMAVSAEFAGGITNGAAWYPVRGGMQVRYCIRVLRRHPQQGIVPWLDMVPLRGGVLLEGTGKGKFATA